MIDLDWIIEQENELTKKAKQNFGGYLNLSLDLLNLLQSIKSFSKENEVAHYFETQVVKGFHLAILNTIRRHSIEANLILRHTFESLILFVYSMENKNETEYKVERDYEQIIKFDNSLLDKANNFIARKYPEDSKMIEGVKGVINLYYSHANILSSQYNAAIIDGRIKSLIFDSYFDEYIIDMLCCINQMICITLSLYSKLQNDYKSFEFEKHFEIRLKAFSNRSITLFNENLYKNKQRVNFPDVEKISEKLHKKYEVENSNKFE